MRGILRVTLCAYYVAFVLWLTVFQRNGLALPGWIVLAIFCTTVAALACTSQYYLAALATFGNIGYLAVSLFLIGQMTFHAGWSWITWNAQFLLWPFSVIPSALCLVLFLTTDSALQPASKRNVSA